MKRRRSRHDLRLYLMALKARAEKARTETLRHGREIHRISAPFGNNATYPTPNVLTEAKLLGWYAHRYDRLLALMDTIIERVEA